MNEALHNNNHPQPEEQPSPMDMVRRVHRLLRGRYALAITLALLGAAALGAAGWLLPTPKYTSVGVIEISPKREAILRDSDLTDVTPFFREAVNAEASKILQDRVLDRAMASTEWRALDRGADRQATREFRDAIEVQVQPANNRLIDVAFTDESAEAARIGAGAIVQAYMDIRAEEEARDRQDVQALRNLQAEKASEIQRLEQSISALRAPFPGSDLDLQRESRGILLLELESRLASIRASIARAEAGESTSAVEDASNERLARLDTEMAQLLNDLALAESELGAIRAKGLGEAHHQVSRMRRRIEGLQASILTKRDELLGSPLLLTLPRDSVLSFGSLDGLQEAEAELIQQISEQEEILATLHEAIEREARIRHSINIARTQMQSVQDRLELLRLQGLTGETGNVASLVRAGAASRPLRPSVDDRRKYAALGVIAGGGGPLALILMLGVLDRRFRYSDEAVVGPSTPLLGILPKLPQRIRDLEQASIAAHCVHQIRTLLQIGGAERTVLVVTSPTAGDGKTSFSLSLGLSFASAGKRTIIIDLDLIGAGLSHLFDLAPEKGTMAAMDAGTLAGHVARTPFPNLAVLPAGPHDAQGISRLTPDRVRTLLQAARKHFDIVLVDTGPVLGSMEAALVVKEADGVVLTVRRGQRREMAQRAIDHIRAIDGKLIGMIFNQAQPADFRRSVSSASTPNRPSNGVVIRDRQSASRWARLGPMPGALAASCSEAALS